MTVTLAIAVPVLIIGSIADLMILFAAGWGIVHEYHKAVIKMQQVRIRRQTKPRPTDRPIDTRTPSGRPLPY